MDRSPPHSAGPALRDREAPAADPPHPPIGLTCRPIEGGAPHGGLSLHSLADLETFMKVVRTGLTKSLKEGDYDGLVEVMGHLMKVKERQAATDTMFEPLKQTIELLRSYGEEIPEETHVKLQVDGPGGASCGAGGGEGAGWNQRREAGGSSPVLGPCNWSTGCCDWGQSPSRGASRMDPLLWVQEFGMWRRERAPRRGRDGVVSRVGPGVPR